MLVRIADDFDPYKALSKSTRLNSAMRYESATNELPLSSIKFTRYPDSPDIDHLNKLSFEHHYQDGIRNEISLMATNERPLSCTCLPKLLADNGNHLNESQNLINACHSDDEFILPVIVLSASCPMLHRNFPPNEDQIFSADFRERLNDYNAYYEHKKSFTTRFFLSDIIPTISDLKSMRKITLNIDTVDHKLANPQYQTNHNPQFSARSTNSLPVHSVLKKPIVTSSPQLSSDPSASNANSRTKHTIISTSSNSTTSNIVTNVNNTTIPHPNIVKIHNSDATQTTQTSTTRRQRHSIAGQMGFFKIMDIAGGFSRKMATSTNR